MDWHTWHEHYAEPGSDLSQRLAAVQEHLRTAVDACPPGPIRLISMCAGDGRDVIGVLARHPRRDDVTARLVELDRRNTAVAEAAIEAAGLPGVQIVTGDAALTDSYDGMVPADVVLMCGVFGNITDADIERTVDHAAQFCATGGTVIWTRGRTPPDLLPQICDWFEARGFDRVWVSSPDVGYGVGVHRLAAASQPLASGESMFAFVGYDVLSAKTTS